MSLTFLVILFNFSLVTAQETIKSDACNSPLGLGSRDIPKESVSAESSADSADHGRLDNADGAWCFSNSSLQAKEAVLTVDLGQSRFISGFASQGPPLNVRPITYNHVVAFAVFSSRDNVQWAEFDGGNLFFNVDKNDTSDVTSYHTATAIEFGRYVKINVILFVSGSEEICLRFEIYGCNVDDIQPISGINATTTTLGKILARWKTPIATNTLVEETVSQGSLSPTSYVVTYWPLEGSKIVVTERGTEVLLDDVRLGATYIIQLQCVFSGVLVDCGSTRIEAYPPCPVDWTGGNEYHCFLLLSLTNGEVFEDAVGNCLNVATDTLGPAGSLIDENEQKFVTTRIFSDGLKGVWIVDASCNETANCCQFASVNTEGTLESKACTEEIPEFALCIRDHKGEGARLRVSKAVSISDGTGIIVTWRYEGLGWKTDELQMKLWMLDAADEVADLSVLTFSTLKNNFRVTNLKPDTMYKFLLRPAPNIRTLEQENGVVVIHMPNTLPQYAAFLTPISVKLNVLWSGYLRMVWEEAISLSDTDDHLGFPAEKYIVSIQINSSPLTNVQVLGSEKREYVLTPIAMEVTYLFRLKCFFFDVEYFCAEVHIRTGPPSLVVNSYGISTIYDIMSESLRDWSSAEKDCSGRDGHLMSLLTEEEGKAALDLFPTKESVVWIGAQLGRNAPGYWTDGTKITELPMAKSSGVTSTTLSCCSALNENNKFRISGGNCAEKLPYICKYQVKKLMEDVESITVKVISWNSIEVQWPRPKERWMASTTEVSACPLIDQDFETLVSCKSSEAVTVNYDISLVTFNRLREFTEYEVTVRALLYQMQQSSKTARIMTYPIDPVWWTITPEGLMSVKATLLVAKGQAETELRVKLTDLENESDREFTGTANNVQIEKIILGRRYKLQAEDESGWMETVELKAVPSCVRGDTFWNGQCFKTISKLGTFDEAKAFCEEDSAVMWIPESISELKSVVAFLPNENEYWFDSSRMPEGFQNDDYSCESAPEENCCTIEFPGIPKCSCCTRKKSAVCTYIVKSIWGKVENLRVSSTTTTSVDVEWSSPQSLWSTPSYEVLYEVSGTMDTSGREIVSQELVVLQDLTPATEYTISVSPFSYEDMRGEASTLTIATLDPDPPLLTIISNNGFVKVRSPRMMTKGRGDEDIRIQVLEKDALVMEVPGKAKGTDFSGLKPFNTYTLKITNADGTAQSAEYSQDMNSKPTCLEDQETIGIRCLWSPESGPKSWNEAIEICKKGNGQLFGPSATANATSDCDIVRSKFNDNSWIAIPSKETDDFSSLVVTSCTEDGSDTISRSCCRCESATSISCGCCANLNRFLCQRTREVDFGKIGVVKIKNLTPTSVDLSWEIAKSSGWGESSFVIRYEETGQSDFKTIVVQEPSVKLQNLKPSSSYKITISPGYKTEPQGEASEINITTPQNVMMTGYEVACPLTIMKISCCSAVVFSCIGLIFVFLISRMFYVDCFIHICSELALSAAFLCILISSAQSYDTDTMCLRADPIVCTTSAVLIQYFFQAVYLFLMLEVLYLYHHMVRDDSRFGAIIKMGISSYRSLLFFGWGVPALILIISAIVASDDFTDGNENCWLDLKGRAVIPSVMPMGIFIVLNLLIFVLLMLKTRGTEVPLFHRKDDRIWILWKKKWVPVIILTFIVSSWLCGMFGAGDGESPANYIFFLTSLILAVFLPILRIRMEPEIFEYFSQFGKVRDGSSSGVRPSSFPFVSNDSQSSIARQKQEMMEKFNTNAVTLHH